MQDGQAGVRPWRVLLSRLTGQDFTIKVRKKIAEGFKHGMAQSK